MKEEPVQVKDPETVPLSKFQAEAPMLIKDNSFEESKRPITPPVERVKTPDLTNKSVVTGNSKSLSNSKSNRSKTPSSQHPEFNSEPARPGGLKGFFSKVYRKICARDNTTNSTVSSENRHMSAPRYDPEKNSMRASS